MAHPDLNKLLDALVRMAEHLLVKQGAFLPIGAIMRPNGEIHHVAGQTGEERPGAQALIKLLTGTFQKEAAEGRIRAAGISYDVLTVPPSKHQKQDAICCGLEHYTGESVDVFKPYARAEDGKFHFEQLFATKRTQQFFIQLPRA